MEETGERCRPWVHAHLADYEPWAHFSAGSSVSLFVCNTVTDIVEGNGQSGDDFMRVAKIPGPEERILFELPCNKGVALGNVLRFTCPVVLEKMIGYDVAPA